MLRMILRETVVEVRVSIDESGKVTAAQPVAGLSAPAPLIAIAVNAAREWRFRPARRGETPVSSSIVLAFSFKPAH
jgi:TonB family protein